MKPYPPMHSHSATLTLYRRILDNRLVPAATSGVLLGLSFPCNPEQPLAIFFQPAWAHAALVPLRVSLREGNFWQGFRAGLLTGFMQTMIALYWIGHTQGGGIAVVGGTFLIGGYLGLYIGLFAGAMNLAVDRWGLRAVVFVPFLWTVQEYLLSLGQLGFPWLLLGHSQAMYPPRILDGAVTGVFSDKTIGAS